MVVDPVVVFVNGGVDVDDVVVDFVLFAGLSVLASFVSGFSVFTGLVVALAVTVDGVLSVFTVFAGDAVGGAADALFVVAGFGAGAFVLAGDGEGLLPFIVGGAVFTCAGLTGAALVVVCGAGAAALGAVGLFVVFGALPCPCAVTTIPPARNSTDKPKTNRVRSMSSPFRTDRSIK